MFKVRPDGFTDDLPLTHLPLAPPFPPVWLFVSFQSLWPLITVCPGRRRVSLSLFEAAIIISRAGLYYHRVICGDWDFAITGGIMRGGICFCLMSVAVLLT